MNIPNKIAKLIFDKMSQEEKDEVANFGCGDYEDEVRELLRRASGTKEIEIVRCMDEIDRLCGYEIYLAG